MCFLQCTYGCSLWLEGLENSCQTVCVSIRLNIWIYKLIMWINKNSKILFQNVTSEAVFSRELYCVMGCNEALNMYFQSIRGKFSLTIVK